MVSSSVIHLLTQLFICQVAPENPSEGIISQQSMLIFLVMYMGHHLLWGCKGSAFHQAGLKVSSASDTAL